MSSDFVPRKISKTSQIIKSINLQRHVNDYITISLDDLHSS